MAETPKPYSVKIDFNGEPFQARLTFADIRRLKENHDIDLFGGGGDNLNDPTTVVKILLVALQHDRPELTYEEVEENLDLAALPYFNEKITDLVGGSGKARVAKAQGGSTG